LNRNLIRNSFNSCTGERESVELNILNEAFNGTDLVSVPGGKLDLRDKGVLDCVWVAPPVPASLGVEGVEGGRLYLRIENHNVIALSNLIVTRMGNESCLDLWEVLAASMKGHMKRALWFLSLTVLWHINVSLAC
jgi:hypothetical protein